MTVSAWRAKCLAGGCPLERPVRRHAWGWEVKGELPRCMQTPLRHAASENLCAENVCCAFRAGPRKRWPEPSARKSRARGPEATEQRVVLEAVTERPMAAGGGGEAHALPAAA